MDLTSSLQSWCVFRAVSSWVKPLCLFTLASLPEERKDLKAGVQSVLYLALTFLAKAAGLESVFDLVLSKPSKTPGDSKVLHFSV